MVLVVLLLQAIGVEGGGEVEVFELEVGVERLAGDPGGEAGLGVDRELTLAHRAVAAQAEVDQSGLGRRGLLGRELGVEHVQLALDLRVEDRVAAGQAHRRPPPLAELGEVEAIAVRGPGLDEHGQASTARLRGRRGSPCSYRR